MNYWMGILLAFITGVSVGIQIKTIFFGKLLEEKARTGFRLSIAGRLYEITRSKPY